MSIRGALSTMPAEDVLDWVVRRKVSAPITFERKGLIRSVAVEDGQIVWASSNRREEQLGVVLVRAGLVAERALADALETRAETGVPLGKVLLMSGLLTERDLIAILATKIRETVTDIVVWMDGTFEVVPRTQPSATGVNAQLPVEICLTVARRRAPRMAETANLIGSDDATFYVPPSALPPSADDGSVIDKAKLWALAGDRQSVADMAATFSGERFAVYDLLAQMIDAGRLVIDRRGRERTNSAVELAAGARGRLRSGDRAGALAMATQALHQDPGDGEVRRTFAVVERARVAEVAKQLLARHTVPKRAGTLPGHGELPDLPDLPELSPVERELAARVDGRWDLLTLIRSAGVREADALLAFARLAELGVVELGS